MTTQDPWAVLGLSPGSSLAAARAARRRLAKQVHPDLHGGSPSADSAELSTRMSLVNSALVAIEGFWRDASVAGAAPVTPAPAASQGAGGGGDDPDSFSVHGLPVDAFEALFLVAYGLGDILGAEEPYLLELYLVEPAPCFCRVTLAPEAGGSIVTVEVSHPSEAGPGPAPLDVIAVLRAELNALVPK